ncbi:translesion DNA synthesis-associated protein ImuA [Massilia sp. LjRoot122]|uniref:translesion DNA synthesis-associated protein ImuA n=1 Tax=Massilia sp. LjRoot122 TaxID=3342257 RepID=UPI003ECCB7D7
MPHDNNSPEAIHPSLWRASQLARGSTRCVDTGHPILNAQLPGGGWPTSSLTELHVQSAGLGEMRLMEKVFAHAGTRPIMLIQPPHTPNALALAAMGLNPSQIIWVQPDRTADALWATEQALKTGACSAVMLWQAHARSESIRRLNLACQENQGLCFLLRPLAAAQDSSPAPLRLALRPAVGGLDVTILKRKGAQLDASLFLPLSPSFVHRHASLDRPAPSPVVAGSLRAELVE